MYNLYDLLLFVLFTFYIFFNSRNKYSFVSSHFSSGVRSTSVSFRELYVLFLMSLVKKKLHVLSNVRIEVNWINCSNGTFLLHSNCTKLRRYNGVSMRAMLRAL